ncbi:MAG: hypothetical protein AAF443_08815 [Chlamydiota bacterium]
MINCHAPNCKVNSSPRHSHAKNKLPPKQRFSDFIKQKKPAPKQTKRTIFDVATDQAAATALPCLTPAFDLFLLDPSSEKPQLPIAPARTFSISGSDFFRQFATSLADYVHTQTDTEKGISVTTITIQTDDPFSHFNDMQIAIKHYDTSPQSFMIDLKSAPEATNLLFTRLNDLQIAFQERLPHFDVHLSPPSLLIVEKEGRSQTVKEDKKRKLRAFVSAIS